ncbi:LysR family transcriptional regulator [Jatrophihabitans sp. YIM 134969]
MDVSTTMLRVLREIAQTGSFTAAADRLGYTQSAVSRQVASLEARVGAEVFERRRDGVRLTTAGATLLRHARVVLDEVDAAERALHGPAADVSPVRLGVYLSAGAAVLPEVVARVARELPGVALTTRDGTSPALVRALRSGTLDLAVVTSRPPHRPLDSEEPRLVAEPLAEGTLRVAVPARGALAGLASLTPDDLAGVPWIASPASGTEPLLGVWPGLPGRPVMAHRTGDWLTKLRLVASGAGVTTVPADLVDRLPEGVVARSVVGAPPEVRRVVLARWPGRQSPAVRAVADVVRAVQKSSSNPTVPVTPTW